MRGRGSVAVALAATALAAAAAGGCSSNEITGEPEDIGSLIHVVPEGSRCVYDRGAGTARFEVRLRNSGEDERVVAVTPVRRDADGDDVGTPLDGFEVTVPGGGEEGGDIEVDGIGDDLAACLVRLDGEDPIEVELQRAGA